MADSISRFTANRDPGQWLHRAEPTVNIVTLNGSRLPALYADPVASARSRWRVLCSNRSKNWHPTPHRPWTAIEQRIPVLQPRPVLQTFAASAKERGGGRQLS